MDQPMNEEESIVSLKKERRDWMKWTVTFWFATAFIGAGMVIGNAYPSVLNGESLDLFNSRLGFGFLLAITMCLFGLYATYLDDKRLERGFTHVARIFFKDEN